MENLTEMMKKWYDCFDRMAIGDRIEIQKYANGNIKLFTDMCKSYIDNGNNDYSFTNDYLFFKRDTP
jgi:hypothetical protein